ncbi:4-(cytidine 5'-diphospho)-2-C-methyl-D-erythritol kinase [Chloroflexota bacterium]
MGAVVADIRPERSVSVLTVLAPAKLNLTLEVLGKRPDDYHEIRSVIQAINLCDQLSFQSAEDIEFRCDLPGWVAQESLVSRVVGLLREVTGGTQGAAVSIVKSIPLVSGLGGDSSDAAAMLRGLNKLWELGLSREVLLELAGRLGSDVAFFLYGGTALAEGRGEIITSLPPLPRMWVVLAVPPVSRMPGKTGQLYASLDAGHYTDGQITERLLNVLREDRAFDASLLFNAFENVAFTRFSALRVSRDHMVKIGALDVHLAGSGPALFVLFRERGPAEELYLRLKSQRLELYIAETVDCLEDIV